MTTYYIDNKNGNDALDGRSPQSARKNYTDLSLEKGDEVLFKRGSFYRDKLHALPYVSYGAYGDGEAPTFCGSTDVSGEENWALTERENVWKCKKLIPGDVGNMLLGDGLYGTFRWELDELASEGDFYDARSILGDCFKQDNEPSLYLYSQGNPAEKYPHIEAISYNTRQLVKLGDGMSFDSLRFINSGVHGMAGNGDHITVRNCSFENIGGCAWSHELRIRFGNGFEIWERGDDILIENCSFKSVYDSCVTHQGPGEDTKPAERFICRGCHFDTYGMAAFEYRDKLPIDSAFIGNTCTGAGCGFAMLGEELPRRSEIWPQPMGHHIFMWRIDHATDGGRLEIRDNHFGPAPVGAAIYSIISPEAEAQVTLENNLYTENATLLNRFGGENFCDLDTYKARSGQDKNSRYIKSKKKIKGLVSTIILGVCLLIALFFASRLLSVDLQEALEQMSQSASNSAGSFENAGEMELVYLLAAGIGVLAVTIAAYIIAIMTLTTCAVPLIFSIRNIKAESKAIKIINIVYTVLLSSGVLLSLTKMLLFYLGVG